MSYMVQQNAEQRGLFRWDRSREMGYFADKKRLRKMQRELEAAQAENQIAKIRANTLMLEMQREAAQRFVDTGYSHGGASTTETWAKKYDSESLSPKSDIELNRKILRERSRDLFMNAPIATAAVNSARTSCVGSGLVPRPKIDYEFLGMTKDEAVELQRRIKKEFSVWADTTLCDVCDLNNFYELQQIAFSDWLKNGEEFVLIEYGKDTEHMPYQLRLRLVSADRISSPDSINGDYDGYDKELSDGSMIMNGVEIDSKGRVVAYYVCSNFPGEYSSKNPKWKRIAKRGKRTGNPNILHIFNADTAEQYRGVPFLAPVVESIKQLTRYNKAEIMAAVINSLFAVFVCSEDGEPFEGFGGEDDDEWDASGRSDRENEIRLDSGIINFLKKGEKVEAVESKHPGGNYDAFVQAMANMIGAALEIASEILMKKFTKNFSASKGALNETWRSFKMRRKWFVNDFCQQVYELWFAEAVSKGRIQAPGFFTDSLIRKSYTNATWNGPAQGCLEPTKEVAAAVTRIENGLSTHEDECAAINGSDFEDNVRTLVNENARIVEINKMLNNEGIEDGEED